MCAKKEPREVLQPIADLDAELGSTLREMVLDGTRPHGSAWVGGVAYYGLLSSI